MKDNTRIIIDADACPSIKLIEKLAHSYNIPVLIYFDNTHNINSDYASIVVVDKGYQSVDMVISNAINENDIVVTQDYGLALIALTKKAQAIHPKGMIYNFDLLDILLAERHINAVLRRNGQRTKGPKKRTSDDDNALINNLKALIDIQ